MSLSLFDLLTCTPFGASKVTALLAYMGSLLIIVAMAIGNYRIAVALRLPALLTTCVVIGVHLYLAMLIPGILGILMPISVFVTLGLSSFAIRKLFSDRGVVGTRANVAAEIIGRLNFAGWGAAQIIVASLAILAVAPLLSFLATFPAMVVSRGYPLPWDTVSYHLPGFIDFLQSCSLWPINFALQSYSFGFELIGGFPAVFFPAHWGHVVAHAYAIVLMVTAIITLVGVVLQSVGRTDITTRVLASLLSLAVWCVLFRGSLGAIGKNDVFMAACLMTMFGLLRYDLNEPDDYNRENAIIFIASSAMVLALATKPPSLAFLPLFVGLLYVRLRLRPGRSARFHAGQSALIAVAVILSGGFFYLRDLLAFGSIVHPEIAVDVAHTTIRANLLNPRIYDAVADSLTFFIAAFSIIVIWFFRARFVSRWYLSLSTPTAIIWFHLTALAAFMGSPWVVLNGEIFAKSWQLRVGMVLFVVAGVLCSVAVATWVGSRRLKISLRGALAGCFLLIFSFLPWWWSDPSPRGLPGFEELKGLPPTQVYRWLQQSSGPLRIVSVNLFPYGLYGVRWSNRVFFPDFRSLDLASESVRQKVRATIHELRPDLIMIGVDPLASGLPVKPAIIPWLRQQTWAREVYCDDTASVFQFVDVAKSVGPPRIMSQLGRTCAS